MSLWLDFFKLSNCQITQPQIKGNTTVLIYVCYVCFSPTPEKKSSIDLLSTFIGPEPSKLSD